MSYKNYATAMEKAVECDGYDAGSGVSDETIMKAEKLLGVSFSRQLKDYLHNYGWLEFFGVELYGIFDDDFSCAEIEGCIVEWALSERKSNGLDTKWIPIRFEDDGSMAFLDYGHINSEGEPPVICAVLTDDGYEFQSELADDLGGYLLDLVDDQQPFFALSIHK